MMEMCGSATLFSTWGFVRHRCHRHALLFVVLALAAVRPVQAQAPARPPAPATTQKAPVPPPTPFLILLRARTAYLVNDKAARQPFDDLSKALVRWSRWKLVDRADTADIVVSFAPNPTGSRPVPRGAKATPPEYRISIESRGAAATAPLWRDADGKVSRLVERLRDEVDGPPAICFAFWCK